jgi:MtN3 and saliva related transmembrane protein
MLEYSGYIAAFCTSMSFLPQAIKVLKTKDTQSLSLLMYSVFTFGVAMWLTYGIVLVDWPMILANLVTLLFAGMILVMKIINYKKDKAMKPKADV